MRLQLVLGTLGAIGLLSPVEAEPRDPARLLPWSVAKAVSDADLAIDRRDLFVYATGGIACRPNVAEQDMELARTLPQRYVACGCVVYDSELRTAQVDYARAFNQRILEHLKSQP